MRSADYSKKIFLWAGGCLPRHAKKNCLSTLHFYSFRKNPPHPLFAIHNIFKEIENVI
jgi:hypothetical protein